MEEDKNLGLYLLESPAGSQFKNKNHRHRLRIQTKAKRKTEISPSKQSRHPDTNTWKESVWFSGNLALLEQKSVVFREMQFPIVSKKLLGM